MTSASSTTTITNDDDNMALGGFTPPPFIASKSQDDGTTTISNMVFFPAIRLLDFQKRYSVDAGTAEEEQLNALITAMQRVNSELMNPASLDDLDNTVDWVTRQLDHGYCKLADVPAVQYGQCSEKVHQYNEAVYAHAKASLLADAPDDEPKSNHLKQPNLEKTADNYLKTKREALRLLLDKPRCTIILS